MAMSVVDLDPCRRSYSAGERLADAMVHGVGISAAIAGSAYLILSSLAQDSSGKLFAVVVYVTGMIAMFIASAAYNLHYGTRWRGALRRCDHAAIFLMIAGTYTPFTTQLHAGMAAIGLTASIWTMSLAGVVMKFRAAELFEKYGESIYLGLGWSSLLVMAPLAGDLKASSLSAVVIGGALYSIGVIFHRWERLKFQNAIWHLFVLCAAMAHYVAILDAVVLPSA